MLGKRHGHGRFRSDCEGVTYEGEWKNGQEHGMGVECFDGGDRYEGQWKHGSYSGRGVLCFANGNRYEGGFLDNKEQGQGRLWFAGGSGSYEGEWLAGQRHGFGVERDAANQIIFTGQWAYDKPVLDEVQQNNVHEDATADERKLASSEIASS